MGYTVETSIPFSETIRKNGICQFDSIFMFKRYGSVALYAFLHLCKKYNCQVVFKNEELSVQPDSDEDTDLTLIVYASLIDNSKPANDYMKYIADDKLQHKVVLLEGETEKRYVYGW